MHQITADPPMPRIDGVTGRAIAAWMVAMGGLLAAIAWEDERSRIRLDIYLLLTVIPLQAIALARYGYAVDWSDAAASP